MKGAYWFFVQFRGIFLKIINDSKPQLIYKGSEMSVCRPGCILRSFHNENCLLFLDRFSFVILPIKDDLTVGRIKTFPIPINISELYNCDFLSFGNKIFILKTKKIYLFKVQKLKKVQLLSIVYIEEGNGTEEEAANFSICDKNRFVLVTLASNKISRNLLVYENVNCVLVKRAILNISNLNKSLFQAMKFLTYVGERIYFTAMAENTRSKEGLLVFYYDVIKTEIREEISYRKEFMCQGIERLVRKEEGTLVGISWKGNILSIKYN